MVYASTRTCHACGFEFPASEKEEQKDLASEADWVGDDSKLGYIKRFERLSDQQIGNALVSPKHRPELLLVIQALKGYHNTWAIEFARMNNFRVAYGKNDVQLLTALSRATARSPYGATLKNIHDAKIQKAGPVERVRH